MKRGSFESKRKSFIVSALRRASLRWFARNEAMKLARVERGLYLCAMCKAVYGRKEIILDHIAPVVSTIEGFTNFDDYVTRMFCDVDGFQVLCSQCSDSKTMTEDIMRTNSKKNKVDKNKKQ